MNKGDKKNTSIQIRRGRYSADLQITRAMLSAASACVNRNKREAIAYLDRAQGVIDNMRDSLVREL